MIHPRFQAPEAFIAHLVKCGFKRYGPVNRVNDFEIYNLDLTSLKLNVGILVPFVISSRLSNLEIVKSEQLSEILGDLDNLGRSLQQSVIVLTISGKLAEIDDQIIEDARVMGIAIIDGPTIETILEITDADERAKLLGIALVRYLGREALSPYVSGRPAIGGRFFGRSTPLQRLVPSGGNFMILGNRRIGKTSLLKEIRHLLKLQNVLTADVYGATCSSTEDVVYKLLTDLGRFREADRMLADPRQIRYLASFVHKIVDEEKRPIAVFIDEVDRILEFDQRQGYELFDLLRETFEHQSCRVFLAGFRKIIELRRSLDFPGFNFTTPIELPLFSREETWEMVNKPLERLGIQVGNTDLPEAIYRETSGHPELIQIHCAEILRYVQKHGRIPSGADLLINVLDSREYKEKILGTFLANTNAYEELLCYLLFADVEKLFEDPEKTGGPTEYEFGARDVNRVFSTVDIKLGIHDIAGIITNLQVSGIIRKVPGVLDKFRFTSTQLINYCIGLDLSFCIAKALARVNEAKQSLWSEPEDSQVEPVPRSESPSPGPVKQIYLITNGVIIAEPDGVTILSGAIDKLQIEDLNHRCLEMVDRWTDHKSFELRLRGIGNQLSTAIKIGVPELPRHLHSRSVLSQLLIISDGEGLKIPFELLPEEKSNLAITAPLARSLVNYRMPPDVPHSFEQLATSLKSATSPLRVLLVASDPYETIADAAKELTVVRKHIETGCHRTALNTEFVEILPKDATINNVEKTLINNRPFHLLHFSGHGKHSSENQDASGIVLMGDNGQPEVIACKRLNRWLKGSGLWLAYPSCCHTSASSGSGAGLSRQYVGTVEAVVDAGIPNVIGFRWAVSDESAFYLADEFYRQLFEVQSEKNLSLAMLEARRAVERRADFFDAWASSMLITQYS